jgi:gliding motility-associated-like protein
LHIDAGPGCTTDSTFVVYQGLSDAGYAVLPPKDCTEPLSGSIHITAASQALPIFYSINGGPPRTSPVFDTLKTGLYTLVITDAGHCEKDTAISLSYRHSLAFPGQLNITPTLCAEQSGRISLALSDTVDPSIFYVALNNRENQSSFSFPNLDSGTYTLHVSTTTGCRFDSTVSIVRTTIAEPTIQAEITDQRCFIDDGSIRLSVSGANGPYLGSLDSKAYVSDLRFDSLAPATYTIRIQDRNTCVWDTSFAVQPYQKDAFTVQVDTADPVCTSPNSGSLKVTVRGTAPPYLLVFGNTTYPNSSLIDNLPQGDYFLPIVNGEGCVVDTVHTRLTLVIKPECNMVYLPDAFTPNGDGTNDLFSVLHNPYLTVVRLKVYNRYGGLVFSSSAATPGWYGTFQAKPQPAGVYVWQAEYTDLEKTTRTAQGTVLLIR